jgi:3-methylcrotonyl-CoA carboxylase alpha subunit
MAEPAITALGSGRYQVDVGSERHLVYGVRQGQAVWVFVDGWVVVVDSGRDTGTSAASAAVEDDAALSAPMPARVLAIMVEPGQRVAKGDVLVTLEAMKMELPVRAPRDGTVAAVSCQTGRMVNAGDHLVELE